MVKVMLVLVLGACVAGCAAKQHPRSRTQPTDGVDEPPTGFRGCPDGYTTTRGDGFCETGWLCVSGGRIKCVAPNGGVVDVPLIPLVPLVHPKPTAAITSGSMPQDAAAW